MQHILIIAVPVTQQVVVLSFIHICFSGIIEATGFSADQTCLSKTTLAWAAFP